ncbi:hypothetical protein [Escherichia phage phiWec179]|nr:hypothetical protein [Escherichia phage phiWec179]BDU12430.1 hypothetical protein [Escherichia phage phiWec181]BDU12870.1 hypothetical protein [Escherichia phage phiWec186]
MRAKSWEEYQEEIEQAYQDKPWTITGWHGEWKGARTKLTCECSIHGEWRTTSIDNAKIGSGCKGCRVEAIRQTCLIDDSIHITTFNKACPDNVPREYYRSDRLDSKGWAAYWIVKCSVCSHDEYVKAGVCNGRFEVTRSSLRDGLLACRCSKNHRYTPAQWIFRMTEACQERGDQFIGFVGKVGTMSKFKYLCSEHGEQTITPNKYLSGNGCSECKGRSQQEFYINVILDEYGEDTGAFKLGIAKDSDIRLKIQNANNNYFMQRVALFDLPSYQACRALESKLKSKTDQILPSIGCVEALHMKDGHSETFLREDLAVVLSAINQAGGIMRQEENYVN